jgi:hypothetical protein
MLGRRAAGGGEGGGGEGGVILPWVRLCFTPSLSLTLVSNTFLVEGFFSYFNA